MAGQDSIDHVVALMLENQSFDRLLGGLKAFDSAVEGIDPGGPPRSNIDPQSGQAISQQPTATRTVNLDPGHDLDDVLRQIAGGSCSGFVADFVDKYPRSTSAERQEVMGFYSLGGLPVLHALAQQFAVCDHWFSSMPGPTWPNRFFVHSGTSQGQTKMPTRFDPSLHVFDQPTVYERLEEQRVSWRIYYGDFPQSLILARQWLFPDRYSPMERFFEDARNPVSGFPAYSFIEPSYFAPRQDDEHPPHDILRGEALIARIYNALRANEELWRTTLFVVLYDEHGGFYDHVAPPSATPPDDRTRDFAFDRYGIRVPALLISPWVDRSVVSTVFDHTSLLKYLTDKWRLGPLGNRVAGANTFASELVKRTAPRTDTPASIPVPDTTPANPSLELNRNQHCLLSFSHFLEARLGPPEPPEVVADRSQRAVAGPESQAQVAEERLAAFLSARTATGGGNPTPRTPWWQRLGQQALGFLGRIAEAARRTVRSS